MSVLERRNTKQEVVTVLQEALSSNNNNAQRLKNKPQQQKRERKKTRNAITIYKNKMRTRTCSENETKRIAFNDGKCVAETEELFTKSR